MDEDEAPKLNDSAADAAAVAAKGPYPKGSRQSVYPIDPAGVEPPAVAGSASSSGGGGFQGAIPMDLAAPSSRDWKDLQLVINSSRTVLLTVIRHFRHFIHVYVLGLMFSFCFRS